MNKAAERLREMASGTAPDFPPMPKQHYDFLNAVADVMDELFDDRARCLICATVTADHSDSCIYNKAEQIAESAGEIHGP